MRISSSLLPRFSSAALLILLGACSAPTSTVDDGDGGGSGSAPGDGDGDGVGDGDGDGDGDTPIGDGDGDIIIGDGDTTDKCSAENPPEECNIVVAPACGDGEINLDPPEPCDDGNSIPGDGCSGACVVEPYHECTTPGQACVSTIVCGDAIVGPGEACDDANTLAGDGCDETCKQVEPGYRCRLEGEPCVRIYICGDGTTDPNEGCDDAGAVSGDGCDERCRIEVGFKCDGAPSVCSATTCGDGIPEGAESCDDGNAIPFDGCTDRCQAEPTCEPGMACTSSCGDGIVLEEECDDGNLRDGDGCSSACTIETGFECTEDSPDSCEQVGGECVLRVPALFRDFQAENNTDFEGPQDCDATGAIDATLNAAAKPTFKGLNECIVSVASFDEWYTDNENNRTMPGSLVLFEDGDGGYVNRLTDDGAYFTAVGAFDGANPCVGDDCVDCPYDNALCEIVEIDGNPMFFPMDDFADAWNDPRLGANVPQEVYGGSWMAEAEYEYWPAEYVVKKDHNFYFTSEVQYWFRYEAGSSATLEFVGDDDMWVFVNGQLAVDLGGTHVPLPGSVTINDTTAPRYNIEAGKVYPIKMFHAERRTTGSSFKLTLSGFTTGRSDCTTNCGDGEVGPGEDCDDGSANNVGGYNKCTPDCTLGPRCGDEVQQEEEACDYGEEKNTGDYGGCAANCELGPFCGDGLTSHDEQCDNGVNGGGYGECAPGCVLGPICGDGGLELEFEECDDGNNEDLDGCSAACKVEMVLVK